MLTKCITFYSYKGGSGRSTTAINTIRALAEQMKASAKHPILLVDADLESAGLTYFFNMKNKFCGEYTHYGTFHTTHIFNEIGSKEFPFREDTKERLIPAPSEFLELFASKNCFGEQRLRNDKMVSAQELFADVLLARDEWRILFDILKKFVEIEENKLRYNPRKLVDKLKEIHIDPQGSAMQKADYIRDFIPARSFPDVSEYFGCASGSVIFLGVDVNYEGAQIAKNSTVGSQIKKLAKECDKNNFAAIVFDSGAGTQSTANAFHHISDVLVYCMRPSSQFIDGTRTNLAEYREILELSLEEVKKNPDVSKNVILLPTAVPHNTKDKELINLSDDSFKKIERITINYRKLIDDYFCTADKALCEVELFKFREYILGVPLPPQYEVSDAVKNILVKYSDPNSQDFPADAKSAYETYNLLAKKIIDNCEV